MVNLMQHRCFPHHSHPSGHPGSPHYGEMSALNDQPASITIGSTGSSTCVAFFQLTRAHQKQRADAFWQSAVHDSDSPTHHAAYLQHQLAQIVNAIVGCSAVLDSPHDLPAHVLPCLY